MARETPPSPRECFMVSTAYHTTRAMLSSHDPRRLPAAIPMTAQLPRADRRHTGVLPERVWHGSVHHPPWPWCEGT
jgi:hypothetical protein